MLFSRSAVVSTTTFAALRNSFLARGLLVRVEANLHVEEMALVCLEMVVAQAVTWRRNGLRFPVVQMVFQWWVAPKPKYNIKSHECFSTPTTRKVSIPYYQEGFYPSVRTTSCARLLLASFPGVTKSLDEPGDEARLFLG